MHIVGIDPGRHKIGVALICRENGEILQRAIVSTQNLEELSHLLTQWDARIIAVGNATGGRELLDQLNMWQAAGRIPEATLLTVDEKNSTLEARSLFWSVHLPTGWRRLVPLSMQNPPVPIDDFAAVVLARRACASLNVPQTP